MAHRPAGGKAISAAHGRRPQTMRGRSVSVSRPAPGGEPPASSFSPDTVRCRLPGSEPQL